MTLRKAEMPALGVSFKNMVLAEKEGAGKAGASSPDKFITSRALLSH